MSSSLHPDSRSPVDPSELCPLCPNHRPPNVRDYPISTRPAAARDVLDSGAAGKSGDAVNDSDHTGTTTGGGDDVVHSNPEQLRRRTETKTNARTKGKPKPTTRTVQELSWIACTRCRTWYHSVCLLLVPIAPSRNSAGAGDKSPGSTNGDITSINRTTASTSPLPATSPPIASHTTRAKPELKATTTTLPSDPAGISFKESDLYRSIPSPITRAVGNHKRGVWWDWTDRVDRWYCPECVHKAVLSSARSIPMSTLKKGWDGGNSDGAASSSDEEGANDDGHGRAQKAKRVASDSSDPDSESDTNSSAKGEPEAVILSSTGRPRRSATLRAPDYHALHNHISTPTAKWLELIGDPDVYGRGSGSASERKRGKGKTGSGAGGGGRVIRDDPFVSVSGSLLTKEWMESEITDDYPGSTAWFELHPSGRNGPTMDNLGRQRPPPSILWGKNREPIVIPSALGGFSSTGGRAPDPKISIDEIATLVGRDRVVDVIDVASQSSQSWSLAKWAEYVSGSMAKGKSELVSGGGTSGKQGESGPKKTDKEREMERDREKGKVFNVISLEISGTALAKQVKPPRLVSEIDWVDNFWPANKKTVADSPSPAPASTTLPASSTTASIPSATTNRLNAHPYPKVQLYCLMGMKGSWTDWHVDFAASSVYYTVLRGAKTFFFIRPTEGNLAAYAKWSGNHEHQQNVWLGDWCDEVRKVTLQAGDTMIIPTGYIHSVHTPEDSLVFGGNYLHSYNIETQLRLRDIEIETKVPQRFRFPYLDKLCWYVADAYVKELRSATAYRPHASSTAAEYHPRVLEGLLALARFLVQQVRMVHKHPDNDDKARRAIHDRIPHDAIKDAAGLARELRWRAQSLLGENSEDEGPKAGLGSKKRKHIDAPAETPPRAIVFASGARTRRYQDIPWEVQEESAEPSVSIVQRVRPASSDFLEVGKMEPAIEESATVRQKRKRCRPSEDGAGIVEEWQEVAITTTTTRWTSDKKVILQAAQRQSRRARSESGRATSSAADGASSLSDDIGPVTPHSANFPAEERSPTMKVDGKTRADEVDAEMAD